MVNAEPALVRHFRWIALGVAGLASLATPLELVLARHYSTVAQFVPFALSAVALAGIAAVLRRPSRGVLVAFRVVMLALLLGSAAGVFFHLRANLALVREVQPDLGGVAFAWAVLSGPAPALAPGLFVQVALLGAAFTYRHPALERAAGASRVALERGSGRSGV